MNYAIVFRLLGYILMIEGALLLLPAVTSLIYAEWAVMGVFLLTAAISAALGFALQAIKPRSKVFYMREGFAATALSWITISIMGAVPFVLTGCIPNPVDAMFETVSGFTTTGASILPGVEGLPNGILFWRSFTHWIGGMGVLVFLLSLLPLTGGSHVNLMKAESPGPQVDKLVPKVQSTAKILYGIYFALTVVEFCFLLAGGMNVFDSLLTAFGTAGTGGFGFKNDSFASFSPYIQWVVTIFMILFGVNFNAYFLLLLRRFRRAASSEVMGHSHATSAKIAGKAASVTAPQIATVGNAHTKEAARSKSTPTAPANRPYRAQIKVRCVRMRRLTGRSARSNSLMLVCFLSALWACAHAGSARQARSAARTLPPETPYCSTENGRREGRSRYWPGCS